MNAGKNEKSKNLSGNGEFKPINVWTKVEAEINTLSNVLAVCINEDGYACYIRKGNGQLFELSGEASSDSSAAS